MREWNQYFLLEFDYDFQLFKFFGKKFYRSNRIYLIACTCWSKQTWAGRAAARRNIGRGNVYVTFKWGRAGKYNNITLMTFSWYNGCFRWAQEAKIFWVTCQLDITGISHHALLHCRIDRSVTSSFMSLNLLKTVDWASFLDNIHRSFIWCD